MAYYSAAPHAPYVGQVVFDLAIVSRDHGAATEQITAAAAGHTDDYDRSRAISLAKLVSLTMATGDSIQATTGTAALEAADTIRSRRIADSLREPARHAAEHQHINEVATRRNRLAFWFLFMTTNITTTLDRIYRKPFEQEPYR